MKLLVRNISTQLVPDGWDEGYNTEHGKGDPVKRVKDYLSFRVDGYQHTRAYRQKKWDGYKSMLKYKRFPTGLLPFVLKFLEEEDIAYEVADRREGMAEFLSEQDWTYEALGYGLADHQKKAILKVKRKVIDEYVDHIRFPRGFIDAATNAGKDLMMMALHKNMKDPRTLVLLEDRTVYKKAFEEFSKELEVGRIDPQHYELTDFTLAMLPTLKNRLKDANEVLQDMSEFNVLFYDECQGAGSNTAMEVLYKIPAGVRVFLSGTPLDVDKKENKLRIIGHSGPRLYKIGNRELMDKQWSQETKVRILLNPRKARSPYMDVDKAYRDRVMLSEQRVEDMERIVREQHPEDPVLIAFRFHEHGEFLEKELRKSLGDDVQMVHGEDPVREQKIQDYKEGRFRVLIASTILRRGENIPRIRVLIMALGGKDKESIRQFLGRVVRKKKDDRPAVLYDWFDVGDYVDAHSRKRIRYYKNEGLDLAYTYEHNNQSSPVRDLAHLQNFDNFGL